MISLRRLILILLPLIFGIAPAAVAQNWPWREWIEADFPFVSIVVDARSTATPGFSNNLTPRALVFPLEHDCYLAYDVDLLRVAVVWTADEMPLTNAGMAVNSYPYLGVKAAAGLGALPLPNGDIWFQNGSYAGVGLGAPHFSDPRPALPPAQKVVHGGIDPRLARFLGIDLTNGAEIEYEIGGAVRVRERFSLQSSTLVRQLHVGPHAEPVFLVLAKQPRDVEFSCDGDGVCETVDGHAVCRILPSANEQIVSIRTRRLGADALNIEIRPPHFPQNKSAKRWSEVVRLPLPAHPTGQALQLEEIPLPLNNPYNRGVRPAAVDFFANGGVALVTFDGDVWLGEGLQAGAEEVVWSRFTSGFHEPLSLKIRNEEIFVFDRNGLWRIRDRDHNGEADYHELFCAKIDQTAETREFASALEVEKDGSFLVCKPGQQATFGAVLRISPDGRDVHVVARGFRQPCLGYDPVTGQIATSDQQGHWVPSTPVAFIEQGGYYGFPHGDEDEGRHVTQPLTWIPHSICGSAMSIVWPRAARMGQLNDVPILLSYHPPRLLQIHTDIDTEAAQGGATPLDLSMDAAPLLKAAVNPADGLLYVVGFQIWGTKATNATFFGRVRVDPTQTWTVPTLVRMGQRGILLRFDEPIDADSAEDPQSYSVRRWNYKRTSDYGSANYRLDGKTGTESLPVSSAKLSRDGRSVFLGIRDMREVMQLEIGYDISARDGTPINHHTFLTAHQLRILDLARYGFKDNAVDLRMPELSLVTKAAAEPSLERGAFFYTQLGCVGCHSVDGSTEGKNGPSWLGLYGSQRKLATSGDIVTADDAYLRESILDPKSKIAEGAVLGEAGMPIYAGVLNEEQLESLLLFIRALADNEEVAALIDRDQPAPLDHRWKVEDFRDDLTGDLNERSLDQGKQIFLAATCFSCHQIGDGKGGRLGPDLAKLDERLRGHELLAHILEPSRRVDDKYKSRTIVTERGKIYSGFVVFENASDIRLTSDPLAPRATSIIPKHEIEQMHLANESSMPAGVLNRFDKQQVLDLLAYIESRNISNAGGLGGAPP